MADTPICHYFRCFTDEYGFITDYLAEFIIDACKTGIITKPIKRSSFARFVYFLNYGTVVNAVKVTIKDKNVAIAHDQVAIEESLLKQFIPIICTSLIFKIIQFIFAIGASDITDMISNSSGGIIGIAIAVSISKVSRKGWIKFINIITQTSHINFSYAP